MSLSLGDISLTDPTDKCTNEEKTIYIYMSLRTLLELIVTICFWSILVSNKRMYYSLLCLCVLGVFTGEISGEEHELIYNNDIVYYDECRLTVSPRDYLQPVRAYAQIQRPCNGTLLWTNPNLHLTITIVNLENDPFTLCFEKKVIHENLIRSIKYIDLNNNRTNNMREINAISGPVLCATSQGNRVSAVIEAQPIHAGVYLRYAMFNDRHPWTTGPFPGWERSEKYLYGPPEAIPTKQKKLRRRYQKKIH